jgi:hypothetical protein
MKKLITPEIAKAMLELSNLAGMKNRAISKKNILFLAQQMTAGRFAYNGEPIIIASNGAVLDGQHRLHAVVFSGITITTEVVEGVDPAAFATIDTGRARTGGDALSIAGVPNQTCVASIALKWIAYSSGRYHYNNSEPKTSNTQLVEFVMENLDDLSWAARFADRVRKSTRLASQSVAGSAVYFAARASDRQRAIAFFEPAMEGLGLSPKTPAAALHTRLINASQGRAKTPGAVLLACCAVAWNAHVKGSRLTLVKFDGSWPRWLRHDGQTL